VQLVNYARKAKAIDVNKAFNPAGVQGHAPPVARIAWLSSPELEVMKEKDFLVEDQNRFLSSYIERCFFFYSDSVCRDNWHKVL
jgi:hypothetical protein